MIKSAATAAAPGAVGKGMMVGTSPGRSEKLPAPGLARLLGGAGKSRGRGGAARSSPMFVTRSRSVGRLAEGDARAGAGGGEPSSPKVTCIGQVRIRNKNKKNRDTTTTLKSKERRPTGTAVERCRCLQRPLLCGMFAGWRKDSGRRPWRWLWWRQWEFSLRSGKTGRYQQRRSIEKDADLMKPPIEMVGGGGVFESDREEYRNDDDDEEKLENEEEEDETRVFVSSATMTPPKNALLLMRCRSAPHNRAPSLAANRFPVSVSPLPPSESKSSPAEKKMEVGDDEEEKEGRNSSNGSSRDGGEEGEEGSRPLVLTRCKSEPARRAVVPEASYCFWANNGNGRSSLVHEERPPPPPLHR
ncbi:LOW QUALITY PROTEIN: uncharacterized protein [Elaeis guineensis]|uniref:LOW QUALITY PROTEIN: uncharacterized protein n=1 Tax=Elaeis guineensis var. tenera TaxID=51953 RepID=UPI003C6D0923